ncbi:nucleoside hydrolase-like domain-containing protein [Novosphingobium lentum]|uniref:nucleoside hydrolase-like domain-containing protein n=1 Tax=Novosphingobium lentum TaxID=145287 RepID=UPI000834C4EB|nr:nucleoside hydrolase-like domain-containing protein [Novosphingobium lentum]
MTALPAWIVRILLGAAMLASSAAPVAARPRVVVLTDIGNEPDDQMSLVRLLLYANEIDIEAIVAVTSTWQRAKIAPEIAHGVIDGYAQALPMLRQNASGWPDAQLLHARVLAGIPRYGLAAIDADHPSPGALGLLAAAQTSSDEPLWVSIWGGASVLAEALEHARRTLSQDRFDALVARLRVYSISDQDDAGPWIRREFPKLFYIVSPSNPDGADYARATWTGISGDRFYRNGEGADFTTVTNAWLDTNIRKGPLGAHYPKFLFIMEGDTPSILGLIPNGLQAGVRPDWGGWGGRYVLRQPPGETRPIWTQGGDSFFRATSADTVDGHTSDQATIWRWREAFQNDFAARIDWTLLPYARANHPPVVVVNRQGGDAPLQLPAHTGTTIALDASVSRDPDGNALAYRWMAYPEAGGDGTAANAEVALSAPASARTTLTVTRRCAPAWLELPQIPCPATRQAHVILAVTDNGHPALTRYRRIVIEVNDDK